MKLYTVYIYTDVQYYIDMYIYMIILLYDAWFYYRTNVLAASHSLHNLSSFQAGKITSRGDFEKPLWIHPVKRLTAGFHNHHGGLVQIIGSLEKMGVGEPAVNLPGCNDSGWIWMEKYFDIIIVHQGKSTWHRSHVLVYISPVLTYLLGSVPCIFTIRYIIWNLHFLQYHCHLVSSGFSQVSPTMRA